MGYKVECKCGKLIPALRYHGPYFYAFCTSCGWCKGVDNQSGWGKYEIQTGVSPKWFLENIHESKRFVELHNCSVPDFVAAKRQYDQLIDRMRRTLKDDPQYDSLYKQAVELRRLLDY